MAELLGIAFLGGVLTGISPCVLPVLPIVLAGGATSTSRRRPFWIIVGLVVSFSLAELMGSLVLGALHLPEDFLFWLGIALLLILAVGLMAPAVYERIERPFSRLRLTRYAGTGGGLVLGLTLGLVFVPCAGPVLAAISVAAAHQRVNVSSFIVTLAYSVGVTLPLLVVAVLVQRTSSRWTTLKAHAPRVRRIAGVVLAVTTLAIAIGLFDPLQRAVPGYTTALEDHVESSSSIAQQLQALSGEHPNQFAAAQSKARSTKSSALPDLGAAPNFPGIVAWLNTPANEALTLAQLRGHVVLVDFWAYGCPDCQRSLPYIEALYKDYQDDGLVVVGVQTPEFPFEQVVSNVQSSVETLGIKYPVAVDSNFDTWDAFNNEYWPAEYLIDPSGEVRAADFGAQGYASTEGQVRKLLVASGVSHLPAPTTGTPVARPKGTTENCCFLGYTALEGTAGTVIHDQPFDYRTPATIPPDAFAFKGVWTDHEQEATAGSGAEIILRFTADYVYVVAHGKGAIDVFVDDQRVATVNVNPATKFYTVFGNGALQSGQLRLSFSQGLRATGFFFN
jgi:cytochrome c biogenesis protein CcdA/thiol-disulfide isomerase/thioredoxin